jgi:hypothetical protein
MHAGVGAAGDRQLNRLTEDGLQGELDLGLDRAQTRLAGPAGEARPVVFEKEPGGQTSSRKTISLASDRRGPSFKMRV